MIPEDFEAWLSSEKPAAEEPSERRPGLAAWSALRTPVPSGDLEFARPLPFGAIDVLVEAVDAVETCGANCEEAATHCMQSPRAPFFLAGIQACHHCADVCAEVTRRLARLNDERLHELPRLVCRCVAACRQCVHVCALHDYETLRECEVSCRRTVRILRMLSWRASRGI